MQKHYYIDLALNCSMKRLEEKICVVTGGSSGIGRAIVNLFTREGATVVFGDIDEKIAGEVMKGIRSHDGKVDFVKTDVTSESEVTNLTLQVIEKHKRIDVLVNNAGIHPPPGDSIFSLTRAAWEKMILTNLTSMFLTTQSAVPYMRENARGSIVNMASIAGISGELKSDQLSYSASKGGVIAFSKQLAVELSPYNIRVNCVCPGYVETEGLRRGFENEKDPGASRKERESWHLLNRFAKPEEVAETFLFLAGDSSSFVTGAVLVVDGGFTNN